MDKAKIDRINELAKKSREEGFLTVGFAGMHQDFPDFAAERGAPCVELGDLGENEQMKAIGLFEHKGVANHPGDLGMQKIAERILEKIKF